MQLLILRSQVRRFPNDQLKRAVYLLYLCGYEVETILCTKLLVLCELLLSDLGLLGVRDLFRLRCERLFDLNLPPHACGHDISHLAVHLFELLYAPLLVGKLSQCLICCDARSGAPASHVNLDEALREVAPGQSPSAGHYELYLSLWRCLPVVCREER